MSDYTGASKDYWSRPQEEKFWSLGEAFDSCEEQERNTQEIPVNFKSLIDTPKREAKTIHQDDIVYVDTDEIGLKVSLPQMGTNQRIDAYLSHDALTTVATLAGMKASSQDFGLYDRGTIGSMVRQAMAKKGAAFFSNSRKAIVAQRSDGTNVIERLLAPDAVCPRVSDIIDALTPWLHQDRWRVCPARHHRYTDPRIATELDVLGDAAHPSMGVKVGDLIEPSIYASDRDFGILAVDMDSRHGDQDPHYTVVHIQYARNGRLDIRVMSARSVCGNLIVWGETLLSEIHLGPQTTQIGSLRPSVAGLDRWYALAVPGVQTPLVQLTSIDLGSTQRERIASAYEISTKAGTGMVLTKGVITQAYQAAGEMDLELGTKTNLGTADGIVQGITYLSQRSPYQGDRAALDYAVGRWSQAAGDIALPDFRKYESPISIIGKQALLGAA